MGEPGGPVQKDACATRKEGVNPLYLVTSKSESSNLNKIGVKCRDKNENDGSSIDELTPRMEQLPAASRTLDKVEDKRQMFLSRTLKRPSTLTSCKTPKVRTIPEVNTSEMIVICIDISSDMRRQHFQTENGGKCNFMQCIERVLKIFITNKHNINSSHKFAIMFLTNTALWMHDFTTDLNKLLLIIKDAPECSINDDTLDMNDIFDALMLKHSAELGMLLTNPDLSKISCTYRVIVLYGRSQCIPVTSLLPRLSIFKASEAFTIDVMFLYSNEGQEENKHEEIFSNLSELDFCGNSYIFAVNKFLQVFECFAQLLGHPLQRPLQQNIHHILED